MSEKPYDDLSHMEGALRRVYQARKSLSHIDSGVLEPDEFEIVHAVVAELDDLEESMEGRIHDKRLEGEWQWPSREQGQEQ